MTDNEIIYCFQNGCDLLKNDDVDNDDINDIKRALEKCAENMLPYIHKYVTKKECKKCKRNKGKTYLSCDLAYECQYTIERKGFKEK